MIRLRTLSAIIGLCFLFFNLQNSFFSYSFSEPSSFTRQDIKDSVFDLIDIDNQTSSVKEDPSTDITEVNYFRDGRFLNSTIWLLFPLHVPMANTDSLNYGMMIDSDFDDNTGQNGIDYQLEIRWNTTSKNWDRILTEWSSALEGKVLELTRNFTGFSKLHSYYVTLSLDLNQIVNPEKFRVLFYAESKDHSGHLLTDFTKWVIIPPPSLEISSSPQSVTVKQGETRTIEIIVNSTPTLEPYIILNSSSREYSDLNLHFSTPALTLPSDGAAAIPLTIGTSEKTPVGPHTIFIFANSSFPSLEFLKGSGSSGLAHFNEKETHFNVGEKIGSKVTRTSLLINVEQAPSLPDQIGDYWNKLGGPISFIYGIAAGLSPWIYTTIRNRLAKKEANKKSD